jgi:hypothetical protein
MEITKERTPKQISNSIEKAITEIRKVMSASELVKDYDWFDYAAFKKNGLNDFISDTCKNNEISEVTIRKVSGINL